MPKLFLVPTLLLALAAPSTPAPATGAGDNPLAPLAFLAGSWGRDGTVVEHWLPPLRGLMVGVNREPGGQGMPFFEFLRIEARSEGVVYLASPRGGTPTAFELTEVGADHAVFENPEHDFPQKIVYRRTGDRLEAEIGGPRNGEWRSMTFRWSRIDCP